jgi:hypothetical protein
MPSHVVAALRRGLSPRPDATVLHQAVPATASLPEPGSCREEPRLRPLLGSAGALRRQGERRAMRRKLAEASAARATGRYARALEDARAVQDEAAAEEAASEWLLIKMIRGLDT